MAPDDILGTHKLPYAPRPRYRLNRSRSSVSQDPGIAKPPRPLDALTPDWVAEIDDASIVPLLALLPWTVTESPGARADSVDFAFRSTDDDEFTETVTRLPLASVM